MIDKTIKKVARILLGANLILAGISHLTFARKAFRAQVPDWVPLQKEATVVYSGLVEIALGSGPVLTDERYQKTVGQAAASFFIAIFPGNISQYVNRRRAFGLKTDQKKVYTPIFSAGPDLLGFKEYGQSINRLDIAKSLIVSDNRAVVSTVPASD